VERGPWLYLLRPGPERPVAFTPAPGRAAPVGPPGPGDRLPLHLVETLRAIPTTDLVSAGSESLATALAARISRPVSVATISDLRQGRSRLPEAEPRDERRLLLTVARDALDRALRTPEEILITLTREEERVGRAVGREARAAESFLTVPGSTLSEYVRQWTNVRASQNEHHEKLQERLRVEARSVVPNLSAVVGERTAARLVSAAGGVAALARMRAGRIQLLGTRRRPSPDRGPRYGILYRADGMGEVPAGRRGAYARSLGAIAAIAVRADATTHRSISVALVARRDRRIAQLRSRRG
jgi:hypothetical protein